MINLTGIKNIIFDFGGVVIDIDFQAAANSFKKLGISDFSKMYSQISQVQLFDRFEKGILSPQEFRTELKTFLPSKITDNQIDDAWNSMILNIPAKRVDLLLNLKNQYRTFLLSNTNKIHYDFYLHHFKNTYGFDNFSHIFEKAYFSFEMGMKKPDKDIFNYVLSNSQLIPNECLFIDDSEPNILTANTLGFSTYLLPPGKDICSLFQL